LPLLVLYPIYAGVMFGKQTQILFPASSSAHHAFQTPLPEGGELVEIPASFGKVRAVYWRASDGAERGPALLYVHGNFELIQDSFTLIQPLVKQGISVLQLEFPGYDGADGQPSFAAINEAASSTFDWLARRPEIDSARIVVMGYSIGGGGAAELTRQRAPSALILLSTYTKMEDLAHRYLLPGFLVRYPYDTVARVREFAGPVFVEHGRHDGVIPYAWGRQIAAAAQHGEFVTLECGHADCRFDRSLFAERLPRWLAANGILNTHATDDQTVSLRE
jgi:fermentation-respiration switch protein FrsA (DUF1100 family)